MPIHKPENLAFLAPERDRAVDETSDETFDRAAFARHALDLVRPRADVVAICEGAARMRVVSGRLWGHPKGDIVGESEPRESAGDDAPSALRPTPATGATKATRQWAMLAIPPRASRRAIALAVAELACVPVPYALDVLFA